MLCLCSEATQTILCDSGAPAVNFERPEQPLDLITEACTNLGLALGKEIHLAVTCAAPELIDYVSCSRWLHVSQDVKSAKSDLYAYSHRGQFTFKYSIGTTDRNNKK